MESRSRGSESGTWVTVEGLRVEICEMAQREFSYVSFPITGETRVADFD